MKINQIVFFFRWYLMLVLPFLMVGCNTDKEGYKTTESGLKYKFIQSGEGVKPGIGDVMKMHISYYTPKDSLLYDSKLLDDSLSVKLVEPTFRGGVEEGFAMMSPGDSALFKVSADSLFEKTFHGGLPVYLNKGDEIYFRVKLFSFQSKAEKDSIDRAMDIKYRQDEFAMLDTFLRANNMDVMPTRNGAYLSVIHPGKGPNPEPGDTIFAEYTGTLIDGTEFDKSVGVEPPFSFVLGEHKVIEGWEECIPFLNKGSVARMVIPSDLAYGSENIGTLNGYSSLVFDVKILDIRKGKK